MKIYRDFFDYSTIKEEQWNQTVARSISPECSSHECSSRGDEQNLIFVFADRNYCILRWIKKRRKYF